ncbi:MAG: thiol peroxidase [Micropruina sp.]|uniref:thiol peroxidase n=1 Tax=Micropruina sp. TaxID=2737536 RepID=UPI0039E3145C
MAITIARGVPVATAGDPPEVGSPLPPFTLTLPDLAEVSSAEFAGRTLVLNIFPSVDTRVCALTVRRFNELAAGLTDTTVLCVSHDLPFALGRFCGAEGIENVVVASAFRSSFGQDYGLTLTDGAMRGLLARTVIVAGADGSIRHVQITENTSDEPDYDAAVAALS